jgi:O-glycosyl hydrolase
MKKTRLFSTVSLLVILTLLMTGCAAPKPAALTDDEVLAIAQNALTALDANDYTAFTRDYSPDMQTAFSENQFTQLRDLLQSASGKYVSTGKVSLSNNQGYAIYRIICKYELEDVVVTVTFKIDGKQIEGFFFDSPNLRTVSQ